MPEASLLYVGLFNEGRIYLRNHLAFYSMNLNKKNIFTKCIQTWLSDTSR